MESQQTEQAPAEANGSKKKAPVPRAGKALPTDRLKFDAQVEALKAFVMESNAGQKAVTSGDIAPHVGVVEATASLNNAFFMDAGLISRESKGRYKPTKATIEFTQTFGFDPVAAKAKLGEPLSKTWFFAAVRDRVAMGNADKERVIQVLANKAGAMSAHRPKLDALLEWLAYGGLIKINGTKVLMGDAPETPEKPAETPAGESNKEQQPKPSTPDPAAGAGAGAGTTKGPAVLEFSFTCSMTAEDLTQLEPEQITALYSAIGGVMAAQSALNSKKK